MTHTNSSLSVKHFSADQETAAFPSQSDFTGMLSAFHQPLKPEALDLKQKHA